MANNEEQNAIEQVKETKKMAEESAKLAANISSGNFIGAAKNALNLLKNKKVRKMIIRKCIMSLIQIMIPILIALCFFSLLNSLKDKEITFLSDTTNSIATFLSKSWQWLTDDYWINLGKEMDYTTKDGETIKATIVDQYIYELDELGISLKDLRLLGDADYSNKEEILKNKDNKALVEKYIAEFIRADIITQQPHRRSGVELVDANNQNKVDGGVYFYRTKNEPIINEKDFENGNYNKENEAVTDKNYVQMKFMEYDEFMKKLEKNDEDLRYRFTIDKETDELILVEIKTVTRAKSQIPVEGGWFQDIVAWINGQIVEKTDYELKPIRIPYKEYIAKYTMPYEFLINLCTITQNPEFVYHVALLARNTKIILAVQDNVTITRETEEVMNEYTSYRNNSGPSVDSAYETNTRKERVRTVITTTTQTPVLRVEYADTWSFYDEFDFTKNVTGELEESKPNIVEYHPSGDILSHVESHTYTPSNPSDPLYQGAGTPVTIPEYWQGTFTTKTETSTQVIKTTTTYNEPIIKNTVEKSKQFLGLLRNSTGKCEIDCYKEDAWRMQTPKAYYCAKKAEFDRDGINVEYRIPNMTKKEAPFNKLLSGLDMLYAVLQSNSSGYKEEDRRITNEQINQSYEIQDQYIANEDYESAYVVKMSGLVDHLRYLMTFPEEESYTIKDLILDTIFGDYENNTEIIPGYDFWWPLDENVNCRISSPFGRREAPTAGASTFHKGIDIARPSSGESIEGASIIASADGIVEISSYSDKAGNYIVINHENGYKTRYLHNAQNLVSAGDRVTRGQVIAYLGNTGNSTGPHLHFEILLNGEPQDPLNYVSMNNKRPLGNSNPVNDETKLDLICAIVASECHSSYEGALAVITCVLNRCDSPAWSNYGGSDPYLQITAPGQFSYGISEYSEAHKSYLNGKAPNHVIQAVSDALNNGVRNHNYTSFRTDSEKVRRIHPNGKSIGGNWYFN